MSAALIDGKAIASLVWEEVANGVEAFQVEHGRAPGLCTILVGDDPASKVYIAGKERACAGVGISSTHHYVSADTTQAELMALIDLAANDDSVDGILVQMPLPKGLDERAVIEAVPPAKDVDGFHPFNVGALAAGIPTLPSCTPAGVMRMLDQSNIEISGAKVTIVGRSNIVGRPLALMMLARDATVTIAHSRTKDLAFHTRTADIVIAAVGVPGLITGDMIAPGATVIDVGINRTDKGLVGDVNFDEASQVAAHITPVPGGVGPMTIAMLLANTLLAARRRVAK